MIENPPITALVSGTGPSVVVPAVETMVDCWRRTPPPKIQTPAAFASRTTACAASPTAGQSSSGILSIEPSSNEIKYRGIESLVLGRLTLEVTGLTSLSSCRLFEGEFREDFVRNLRQSYPGTSISRTGWPRNRSFTTLKYSRMASLMFSTASASDAPCEQQPGRPGTETE